MSVLVTMRVKVHDFEGVKAAMAKYVHGMRQAGCHWAKVYRAEKDPLDVLFLMEWESHDAFNASGDETGDVARRWRQIGFGEGRRLGSAASRLGMRVVPQCPHPCRQTLAAKNAEAGTRGGFG